jgi:nucleotide-binding universal stress UspA family protein
MAKKSLLVAVDFSEASKLVVQKAGELAQQLSAKIVLLHVVEPTAASAPGGSTSGVAAAWPLKTRKRLSNLKARLRSLASPLKAAGIEVEFVALVGLLADEILDLAVKCHADYIILGSHGNPAARHLTTGDHFSGMLTRLTCPLVVVPVKTDA